MTQPTNEPKFCKDCAYFEASASKFQNCHAPVTANLNLVHGRYYGFCEPMRRDGHCGPEAKLFQQAPQREFVVSPDRPLIVYAASGVGKTRFARLLAGHFGKRMIVDGCSAAMASTLGVDALALTNDPNVAGAMPLGELLIKIGQDLRSRRLP